VKLFLVLCAVLMLCFCGPKYNIGRKYTVGISPEFSNIQQQLAVQAAYEWIDIIGNADDLSLDIVIMDCDRSASDHRICIHPSSLANIATYDSSDQQHDIIGYTMINNYTQSSNIYIALDANLTDAQLQQTIGHELGHAFEEVHSPTPTSGVPLYSIMCRSIDCATTTVSVYDKNKYLELRQ
jgi:hypothetical protein